MRLHSLGKYETSLKLEQRRSGRRVRMFKPTYKFVNRLGKSMIVKVKNKRRIRTIR